MENITQNSQTNSGGTKKRKQGHRVPKDLKEQILKRIKVDGIPVGQAAEEHGVVPKTIYNWLAPRQSFSRQLLDVILLGKVQLIGPNTLI
jgi:hypothetical protein